MSDLATDYYERAAVDKIIAESGGLSAGLRALADAVDAEPVLAALLRGSFDAMPVFPHLYSVEPSSVVDALLSRGDTTSDEGSRTVAGDEYQVTQVNFPGSLVCVRVFHPVTEVTE